nr:hypothetical protein [Tanacetum cinerariifolium]
MSTQQDIYVAGFENRPPMLNKEKYVPWSSRLLRRMIPKPGDPNREVPVNETFHVQTNDELTEKELKMIEADDQAIQTILLGLPKDIYAAVDSCETAQEIWLHDLKAERLAKTQDPLALMATSNNPYTFPVLYQDQPSFNQNYMQQPMPNSEDITDPTTAMNMALSLMAKAFKLNYSTPTNNNQRISLNPRNRQIAQPGNLNGYNDVQNVRNQNLNGNGNLLAARAEGNATGHNGNQIRCYNCRGLGIQLQAEEFDLMAATADLDEIEEVNANYILMANLQQASTRVLRLTKLSSMTQTDQLSVEQSGGTVEQHPANVEKTRVLYDSLYNNLAIKVEKDNTVNRKLSKTNAELTTELARYKNKKDLNKQFSVEKSNVSSLLEEKKKLKSDFKIREDELVDKQIQLEKKIKELNNILVKMGQLIQTIHMLSPKPDSFYHTELKMALGYQSPFYIKQAQQKQQSLSDGKVLFEKHDPPVVHDSKETLQLAQEKTHNWPSSAHQELHKIVKDEIFPIVNQVDARVQNFEIQFLKEEAKFVGDFKSLAKEADESLVKHKALELEIKRLLRAVIDRLARSLLIQGLLNDIYSLIDSNKTTKDLWDALARHMLGSEYGEQDKKAAVLYEYETFKANEGELLLDTYI